MVSALDTTFQDLRYALRGLARNPVFALTAIVAASLGIGATSAVFSAVDRVLFRSLPYANENTLVSAGMMAPLDSSEFLLPDAYFQLRHDPGPLAEVTAFQAGAIDIDLTASNPQRLRALRIEANFLHVFGINPLLGRAFTRDEDRPNGPPVALISYGLWRSRFAADPLAVGKTIPLDGAPAQIVGILPKDFLLPTLAPADVLLPLALDTVNEHSGRALRVFARLPPGLTSQQASSRIQPQFRRMLQTVPPRFQKEISFRIRLVRDRQVGDVRAASLALFGSVLAVLLIASANIATLLLARAVAREREIAVRTALGASRLRLVRQSLTESLTLSAISGVFGCLLAWLLLRIFVVRAASLLPRLEEASIDSRMLLFTLGATIGSGLLFGLAAALQRSPSMVMRGARSTMPASGGLRSALVTLELAFSMILLTAAALLLHSLWNLQSAPLGMNTSQVLTARFILGRQHYGRDDQQLAFFNELEQRLAAIPGVEAIAISDSTPPSGGMRARPLASIAVEGAPALPVGTGGMVAWRYISPGYFAALGIPIVRGRAFANRDRDPNAFSAILSESLARRLFPHQDPLGQRILQGPHGQWTIVIGVARDVVNAGAQRASSPEYYIVRKPSADFNFLNQEPPTGWRAATIVARTSLDQNSLATALRQTVHSLDSALPLQVATMSQRLLELDQRPRLYAILLAVFAAVGVLIAAVGLFGVMSFLAIQRTREIGVRMALGATPAAVGALMFRSAARWTAAGLILGVLGSLAATRLLQSLLFHVAPADPVAIAAATLLLAVVAFLAAVLPAQRAARLDPIQALRQD